jgi:hypothetical protein
MILTLRVSFHMNHTNHWYFQLNIDFWATACNVVWLRLFEAYRCCPGVFEQYWTSHSTPYEIDTSQQLQTKSLCLWKSVISRPAGCKSTYIYWMIDRYCPGESFVSMDQYLVTYLLHLPGDRWCSHRCLVVAHISMTWWATHVWASAGGRGRVAWRFVQRTMWGG